MVRYLLAVTSADAAGLALIASMTWVAVLVIAPVAPVARLTVIALPATATLSGALLAATEPLVLAAADPAQPYGGVLPWPKRAAARAARVAGAHVVLLGGAAALYVERGGRSLLPLCEPDPEWLRPAIDALVAWVRADRGRRLAVERFDGRPVVESEALELLVEAGFLAGPKRAVLRS